MLYGDVSRCRDSECPDHEGCERWLERNSGKDWTPHVQSLREGHICHYLMPVYNKVTQHD